MGEEADNILEQISNTLLTATFTITERGMETCVDDNLRPVTRPLLDKLVADSQVYRFFDFLLSFRANNTKRSAENAWIITSLEFADQLLSPSAPRRHTSSLSTFGEAIQPYGETLAFN